MKSKRKTETLYLGWDGSYVLSHSPLVKKLDHGSPYLSPRKGQCLDIQDGAIVFASLGLKKYEVVKLTISVEACRG